MRAAPFARVFVKFTAAMLGDLQFPADDYHVIFVIRSFSCQDVSESGPMAHCISKRTWGRQSHRSRN
jgi:hypothetical protein